MSNLLKDASILLTPTGYDNGRMNAIKPYKDLYGPELVTNGDFSNGSTGWTLGTGMSIINEELHITNNSTNDRVYQNIGLVQGKIYQVSFDVLSFSGTSFQILMGGSSSPDIGTISSTGSYTFIQECLGSNGFFYFMSTLSNVVIDNVSVVEDLSGDFTFSRNSAATRVNAQGLVENVQILSPELVSNGDFSQIGTEEVLNGNFSQEGSELITNGDFTTDSDWSQLTNSSIINGKLVFNGSGLPRQANVFQSNKTFKITLNVSDYTSGQVRVVSSGYANVSDYFDSVGVYTFYFNCGSLSTTEVFIQSLSFIGSIDSISVKEVGQNWELDTGWSIGDDKVEADGTSAFLIQSNFQSVASVKSYKIQYEVLSTNGVNIRFGGGSSMFGTPTLDTATIGVKTIYLQSNGTVRNLQFQNNLGFIGSITNISVKEVGQDWTLGTGWSIDQANSKAVSDTTASNLTSSTTLISGRKYKFKLDSEAISSGSYSFLIRFNSTNTNVGVINSDGSHEFVAIADSTSFRLQTLSGGSTDFSITNISVKEITDDTDIPRINYSGFSYQDSLGSELVTNGDFSNGSANWINVSNLAVFENSSVVFENDARIYQNVVSDLTKTYNIEINFSAISGNGIMILVGNGNSFINYSVSDIINNGNKINISKESFIGSGILFIYSQNSSTSAVINNVSVKEYLGQEVVPDSGCGSWLLEPQSTNTVPYSSDFSQWTWGGDSNANNTTRVDNQSSPDGETNAALFTRNAGTGGWFSPTNLSVVLNQTYTYSLFVKKGTSSTIEFRNVNNSLQSVVVYNIDTDTFTTEQNATGSSVDYGNGWYRIAMTFEHLNTSTTSAQIRHTLEDGESMYVFGSQLENLSYATSYIPTSGATNTRLQDIATNSGNASLINSTEGVLYAEIAALANDGTDRFISISDNTNNNILRLQYITTDNSINSQYKVGGVTQASLTASLNSLDFNKIAVKYKENDFSLWTNGVKVATDNSGAVNSPGTFTEVEFTRGGNALPFYGKTKALAVYKEALTDANLRCLTYPNPVATTFDLDFDTIANDFTFTRGSEATFVNEQGLIESTNQLGPELVTNGDFSNGSANWTLDGSNAPIVENGLLKFSFSNGTYTRARQNIGIVNAKITYTVVNSNVSTFQLRDYGGAGSQEIPATVGTHTIYRNFTGNGINFQIGGVDSGILEIDNVSVKEVITATNTPRIDYSTGAKAFLLEPQSTNYSQNSEQPSTWHSSGGVTITANAATSPEGIQNSSLVVTNASSGERYVRNNFGFSSGSGLKTVTTSYFIKYYNNQWVRLRSIFFNGSPANNVSTFFDVQNGVLGTVDANHTAKIEDYGNGWYRCSITFDIDKSVDSNGYVHIEAMDGDNSNTYAAIGQGYYAYGSQGEEFSYPTSYIPSGAAYTTRNQELCLDATPVINSTEGTLYAEISALADDTTNERISLSYDNQNFVRIAINNLQINFSVFNNGAYQANMNYTVSNITDFNKIAVKYKENDFALWINGTEVLTDTSGLTSFSSPLDHINFSNANGGGSFFYGNTKGLKYYPKALADVQLEDLTTI